MRRAGFRPGVTTVETLPPPEGPLLSVPDCVYAGTCPRPPVPTQFFGVDQSEIDDFYDAIVAAEGGDPAALDTVRDYLAGFNYGLSPGKGDEQTSIMRAGCPIEFDLVRTGFTFDVVAVRMNGRRGPLEPGSYWHPLNIPNYVTKWDLSGATAFKTQVTVTDAGENVDLRAVWADSYADLIAGDWQYLGAGIPLDTEGHFQTSWQSPPEASDVVVGFVLEAYEEQSSLAVGTAEIRVKGVGDADALTCDAADTISFNLAAPGRLTVEGDIYYADYKISPSNFGYTEAQVRTLVSDALGGSSGWQQAGIIARETPSATITFQMVENVTCSGTPAVGCSQTSGGSTLVTLKHSRVVAGYGRNIVNHEAGHAYFSAGHTGSGIMHGGSPDG